MEKIEFIRKKETPSKFRAIVNINDDYNVSATLTKQELKGVFFNIKNLLEDRSELNEPEFSKRPKKEIVVEEVVKEVVVEKEKKIEIDDIINYLQKCDPETIDKVYSCVMPDDDHEILVLLDDEAKTETPIDLSEFLEDGIDEEKPKKKKGGFFGIWSILLIVGSGVLIGAMNPTIIDSIKSFFIGI